MPAITIHFGVPESDSTGKDLSTSARPARRKGKRARAKARRAKAR